jgi:hypothetical protein
VVLLYSTQRLQAPGDIFVGGPTIEQPFPITDGLTFNNGRDPWVAVIQMVA